MPVIFLGLGSNLGDREANLREAINRLMTRLEVTGLSAVYETAPMYVTDQPAFLNMVARAETSMTALDLLDWLQALERNLGRQEGIRYGPRLIDFDILIYADQKIDSPRLILPHPRLHERAFVLRPLADLAPDWVHPISRRTVNRMLTMLPKGQEIFRTYDALSET